MSMTVTLKRRLPEPLLGAIRQARTHSRQLAYDEFAKGWKVFALIYTVDVARLFLWPIRSRLAQMGSQC